MASKRYTPTCTKDDFDRFAGSLRAEVKRLYNASKKDSEKPPTNPATAGAFDHVPDLDSKTVAKWSATVKKYLGCKLNPALIRRGGYNSFDEGWADISAKLRETCLDAPSVSPTVTR